MAAKCEELDLKMQCMPSFAKEAKCLHTRVAKLKTSSETKLLALQTKWKTPNMKVVSAQARTKRDEYIAWVARLEGGVHELKGKLEFIERHNSAAGSRDSLLVDDCSSFKLHITSGEVCCGAIVQRLAIDFKDVDASINGLNCHAAHAQKAVRNTFQSRSVSLSRRFQRLFQQEVTTFLKSEVEATRDAVTILQGNVPSVQATLPDRLERLGCQGGLEGVLSSSQCGPSSWLVDQISRSLDSLIVCMLYCRLKMMNIERFLLLRPHDSCFARAF